MKFVLAAIAILLSSTIPAQDLLPTKDNQVYFELIDSSAVGTAEQLHNKAKLWFVEAFKDAKDVIQLDDKATTTILGKGLFKFSQGVAPYNCKFTVKIMTKDNKYRAQVYDIIIESGTSRTPAPAEYYNDTKPYGKMKEKIREHVQDGITAMLEGLKRHMQKSSVDSF